MDTSTDFFLLRMDFLTILYCMETPKFVGTNVVTNKYFYIMETGWFQLRLVLYGTQSCKPCCNCNLILSVLNNYFSISKTLFYKY